MEKSLDHTVFINYSKTFIILQAFQQPKYLSLLSLCLSVLANFSMLFLSLVWCCLSFIPYLLHKIGQVVQGLLELIPFSPDFSNLPTCYSYNVTSVWQTTSNYRIYFPIRRRRKTFARIIKVAPVDAEYWVTEDTFALVPGSTAEEKNVSKIFPGLWFTSWNEIKPLPFPKSL